MYVLNSNIQQGDYTGNEKAKKIDKMIKNDATSAWKRTKSLMAFFNNPALRLQLNIINADFSERLTIT